jgi:plasmid maintenance system antidote protein VapI
VSDASVSAQLPGLLAEHGLTYRTLASLVGVTHTHLVRIVHEPDRHATGELAARIAAVLGLADDHFPETREAVVLEAVKSDPAYRDRLYASMATSSDSRRSPGRRRSDGRRATAARTGTT